MRHEQLALFFDHLARQMQRGAHARAAVAELAGVLGDFLRELCQVLHPGAGGRHQHQGLRGDQADGCEVLDVVLDLLGHQLVDGDLVARTHQQGVAVRCGAGHFLRANGTAGTANVLYHHRHAQAVAQLGGHHPARQVGAAAWRITHHDGDGLAGIRGFLCDDRGAGQHGQTAGQGGAAREMEGVHGRLSLWWGWPIVGTRTGFVGAETAPVGA